MKILYLVSFFLILVIAFAMSCTNEDSSPNNCNGSLSLEAEPSNLTTCVNDGSITVTPTGGKSPYQYSLNGGTTKQPSATFSGLSAGTYSVTVFDDNDCENTETGIEITSTSNLGFASVTPTAETDCVGNNGSIVAVGSGGTGPYTYALNAEVSFVGSGTFNNKAAGTYTVKVKDANNCIFSQSVVIAQSTSVSFDTRINQIISTSCATNSSCHASGATGRPVLTNHTQIQASADRIKIRTQSSINPMPPSGSLTAQEMADIACWVDGGAPNN
jgi:cytochrome c5